MLNINPFGVQYQFFRTNIPEEQPPCSIVVHSFPLTREEVSSSIKHWHPPWYPVWILAQIPRSLTRDFCFNVCLCLLTLSYTDTNTHAGVFPTASTEIHKYFAQPFIIQNLSNTSCCMGNKFGWHWPQIWKWTQASSVEWVCPVCAYQPHNAPKQFKHFPCCVMSPLAENMSRLHLWQLKSSSSWVSCCLKGETLRKPLPVTPITHCKAPLPTASATLRYHTVSRQKDNLLFSCSGGLAKQADSV